MDSIKLTDCHDAARTRSCLLSLHRSSRRCRLIRARKLHQGIDGNNAFAFGPHDQRVDLGLGDGGIIRQLRQRDDGMRQRVEVSARPMACRAALTASAKACGDRSTG